MAVEQPLPLLLRRVQHGVLRAVLLAVPLAPVLVGATSCAPSADQVELRLFPCDIDGIEPRSVVIEITGFDAEGTIVETFEVGFDDIAAQVFDDGYATVGYRSDPDVVTAMMRVGWFAEPEAGSIAEANAVVVYDSLMVPAHGEVLSLNVDGDCSPIAGDGDGDTGDGDNTGDGDGDTGDGDGDTGDGDGDNTGDGDGDGDGDTGDGDGDGDNTGDGDGDGDTGDGDGDTGDGDGDGDGDPVDLPMIGDPCNDLIPFACVPELDGDVGTPLRCLNGTLMATAQFAGACGGLCPPGSNTPVNACGGFNIPAQCMCQPNVPEACNGAQLGCFNVNQIKLCHNGNVVIGQCNNCTLMNGYYSCTQ